MMLLYALWEAVMRIIIKTKKFLIIQRPNNAR